MHIPTLTNLKSWNASFNVKASEATIGISSKPGGQDSRFYVSSSSHHEPIHTKWCCYNSRLYSKLSVLDNDIHGICGQEPEYNCFHKQRYNRIHNNSTHIRYRHSHQSQDHNTQNRNRYYMYLLLQWLKNQYLQQFLKLTL